MRLDAGKSVKDTVSGAATGAKESVEDTASKIANKGRGKNQLLNKPRNIIKYSNHTSIF